MAPAAERGWVWFRSWHGAVKVALRQFHGKVLEFQRLVAFDTLAKIPQSLLDIDCLSCYY